MSDIPFARPSSTVILARDADNTPEFLLVRRVDKSAFGGAHVFPGGVVDDSDAAAAAGPSSLEASVADRRLATTGALRFYSAALRELFEETGVLLAHEIPGERDKLRESLLADGARWPALLQEAGIRPAYEQLCYISEWITPTTLPKRFATRFFVTGFDGGQQATPCGGELTECRWIPAGQALAEGDEGEILLHPPTRLTLEQLARHASVASLLDWARAIESRGAPSIAAEQPTLDSVRAALAGEATGSNT